MGFASIRPRSRWEPYRVIGTLLFLGAGLIPLALLGSAGTQGLIAVAVAAVLYILIFIHIHLGLGLLVVCFGLSPEFEIAGISNFRIEDLFIPVVILAWATRLSMRRESLEPTDLKVPILCLIGLSAISTLLNVAWWDLPLLKSILFFGKTVEYYLIFLVVMNVVKTREQVVAYAVLLIAVSLAGGLFGLHQYLTEGLGIAGAKVTGPVGETANIFGGYLAFHMLLAAGMAISIPGIWARIILGAYLFVNMFPLLYTFSRTTFASFVGGLLALGMLRRGRALFGVVLFLVLLPFLFPEQVSQRFGTILSIFSDNPPPSWSARLGAWQKFGGAVRESPLIGRGVASIPAGFIDNEYIKQAHELGLAGLIVLFWLLFRIFRTALYTIDRVDDRRLLGFCTGFAAGFAAILIHNLGATSLTSIRIAEPFFFATGLLYAVRNHMLPDGDAKTEMEPRDEQAGDPALDMT
ncbi:MAG: hypothetical protein O6952_06735 [Planctomycetota bacterium]|nr:hypothetical protein [Planctomycetota bacterium]